MNWLTLLGGLAVALVAISVGGGTGFLVVELAGSIPSLAVFGVVVALMIAVVGLGVTTRRNAGRTGEPYW